MFIIEPFPLFTIGKNSAQRRVRAETLRLIISVLRPIFGSGNGPYRPKPALFTSSTRGGRAKLSKQNLSSDSNSSFSRPKRLSVEASSVRSHVMCENFRKLCRDCAGGVRDMLNTREEPQERASRKKASPIPDEPPVMNIASYADNSADARAYQKNFLIYKRSGRCFQESI